MAFHLNVRGPLARPNRFPSTGSQLLGIRTQMRWNEQVGYLELPKMHVMSAVLTFFIGVTIASLHLSQIANARQYDMTPTGSIPSKAPVSDTKPRFCQ